MIEGIALGSISSPPSHITCPTVGGVTMCTAMALCRLERCTGFVGLVDDVIASGKESNIWKPTRLERTPGREPLNPERELGLASHVKTLTMQNTGRRITS